MFPRTPWLSHGVTRKDGVMSVAEVTHLNLNSSRVVVASDTVDVSTNATSIYTVLINGYVYEFASNHRDFGVEVGHAQNVTFDEEYSLQRGILKLGSRQDSLPEEELRTIGHLPPYRFGTWEGERRSVHTHRYGGDYVDLIAAFNSFQIVETEFGIRLISKSSKAPELYHEPSLLKDLGEVGLLQIRELTRERARGLPKHRGTSVRGGELFLDGSVREGEELKDCSDITLWLANDSSVTAIMPHPRISSVELIPRVSEIAVSWQAAPSA
jgi:hypothetical protein